MSEAPAELADVLRQASATLRSEVAWKRPVWTVDVGGVPAVLHRHPAYRTREDLQWELGALEQIAVRFPFVARPVPAFAGAALLEAHGAIWTLQEQIPADPAGWDSEAPLELVGAFVAGFHEAVRGLDLDLRPSAPRPLAALAAEETWVDLQRQVGDDTAQWFLGLRDRVLASLNDAGVLALPSTVIHGDLTVFNVLVADGEPRGLVDFALSSRDVEVLDLAYAAWTWSRDRFAPDVFHATRLEDLVRGYHRHRPLADAPSWLPDAVLARAFQLVARWLPRRPPVDLKPTLSRLRVLDERRSEIAQATAHATR